MFGWGAQFMSKVLIMYKGTSAGIWHIASLNQDTATMETGVLQLQVRSCGTAF